MRTDPAGVSRGKQPERNCRRLAVAAVCLLALALAPAVVWAGDEAPGVRGLRGPAQKVYPSMGQPARGGVAVARVRLAGVGEHGIGHEVSAEHTQMLKSLPPPPV